MVFHEPQPDPAAVEIAPVADHLTMAPVHRDRRMVQEINQE
tara:strand:+ start:493 stop:615 length:123 start_codon:yes stop_codon:yes gene_type:complete